MTIVCGICFGHSYRVRFYLTLWSFQIHCDIQTLKTCFMLYNLYNPDTKKGRTRIYKRAYRFYNNLPRKGYTNWNLSKVILITVLSIVLAIIYSYARLNFSPLP